MLIARLKYDQIEVHKDIIPETRQEWRDYVKEKILAPVLVLVSWLEGFSVFVLDGKGQNALLTPRLSNNYLVPSQNLNWKLLQ